MGGSRGADGPIERAVSSLPTWASAAVAVIAFLFAVRLLGTATGAGVPALGRLLGAVLVSDPPALGLGWLAAATLGNGTVVAVVSLSLHATGLVTVPQLFLLVVGSRLGATGVVIFIGGVDHLRGGPEAVGESLELGLLAAGLTATVYLPTAVAGYVLTRSETVVERVDRTTDAPAPVEIGIDPVGGLSPPTVFEPLAVSLTDLIGAPAAALCAVGLVFVALDLFDRVLGAADTERVRSAVAAWLDGRWRAAAVGGVVTALTTSVAFSLGVVVPLYNRGYVSRRETVPYVLGANVGTLADTLAVAVLIGDGAGIATVLSVTAGAVVVTTLALVAFRPFLRLATGVLDAVLVSWRRTVAALVGFIGTPLGLVLFG